MYIWSSGVAWSQAYLMRSDGMGNPQGGVSETNGAPGKRDFPRGMQKESKILHSSAAFYEGFF